MNYPRCFNCGSEIGEEQRVCSSCGAAQWYNCSYCEKIFSTVIACAQHEMDCEENIEGSVFDF